MDECDRGAVDEYSCKYTSMREGILADAEEYSCEYDENEMQEACRSGKRTAGEEGEEKEQGLIKAKAVNEVDAEHGRATQA